MHHFNNKVVYQVYPKSFKDSNGDGEGDIKGIIEKLDYLKEFGIDYLWVTPVFLSPMNDNGYDVADYYKINPQFGTMDDMDELIRQCNKRGIGLMLDMVFNHTSTDHEWFQKALSGDKEYQDYYIFKDGKEDELPTNWQSKFGGPAWKYVKSLKKWYLHLFDVTQADLNWRNPKVREELKNVVRFWKEKGVKGFRFDVVNLISKPDKYENDCEGDGRRFYTDGMHVHEYLKELVKDTGIEDMITVGEMSSTSLDNCIRYSNPEEKELSMCFNFHHLKVDYKNGNKWELMDTDRKELKRLFEEWQIGMQEHNGWNSLFWCNHDQPRIVSRMGNEKDYWKQSAKMLAAAVHLMRGTPYIYQGEEIGMTNYPFRTLEELNDIESLNYAKEALEKGGSIEVIMDQIRQVGRDNARTPMQWDTSKNAGFSISDKTWLPINPNYKDINVESALANPESIFYTYQKLVELRKTQDWLVDADFELLETTDKVFAYIRKTKDSSYLVVVNLSDQEQDFYYDFERAEVVIANTELEPITDQGKLQAWDAICVKVK